MTVKISFAIALVVFLFSSSAFSQNEKKKIDVNKDIDVVRVYEQVVREGYGTAFIYRELATAHYFRNNYDAALRWFVKLFSVETIHDPDLLHKFKQVQKAVALQPQTKEETPE